MRNGVFVAAVWTLALLGGCEGDKRGSASKKTGTKPAKGTKQPKRVPPKDIKPAAAWAWTMPKGLGGPPKVPADNPMTKEKVALGHQLFMDKRLSADGSRSCYSCHQNHHGNGDGRKTALGAKGKPLPRNTPTIWNVAYQPALYWAGRAPTLEKQGIGALKGGNMGLGDELEAKAGEIGDLPEYKAAFRAVFGLADSDQVNSEHIAKALSAYQRTLLCGDTAFDKQEASEAAQRGHKVFLNEGGCVTCHAGTNFSDGAFHVTGVAVDPSAEGGGDVGRSKVTKNEADKYKFRTPTLRNVSKTAPYFHDGSVASLEEAVKIMVSGGVRDKVTVDNLLLPRKLTAEQIKDLVAFLESLACPGELVEIGDQSAEGIAKPS